MAIPTCPYRHLAAALLSILLPAAVAVDAAAQTASDRLLPAGRDAQNEYWLDPDSLQRDGSTVRFRLSGTGVYRHGDTYDAQVMVDCAQHTRREMGSVIHNQYVGEKHNRPDTQMRDVLAGTRQESELRLVCRLAGVPVATVAEAAPAPAPTPVPSPAPAPAPATTPAAALAPGGETPFAVAPPPLQMFPVRPAAAQPPRPAVAVAPEPASTSQQPWTIATEADIVPVGADAGQHYDILVDSVRRNGNFAGYDVQAVPDGAVSATRRHYVVDCAHLLRAFQPEGSPQGVKLTATHPRAGSREARELATACAMPEGPRTRWFAGFVVTADGVVVAPHARTTGCAVISTGIGPKRRALQFIGHEDDVTLLRLPGSGPWPVMPSYAQSPALGRLPVTLLGVSGTEPRVSAAFAEDAGANERDPGWPQVRTLGSRTLPEGIVWNASGSAIGFALALQRPSFGRGQSFVRMLPASEVRLRLERHGLAWRATNRQDVDPESAMRLALSATVPLICTRAE